MRFKDKAVLITGGGRGIGAATSRLFAEEEAKVGILDLSEKHFEDVVRQAKERGLTVKGYPGDVTQKEQIERALEAFVGDFGGIDVLVNNAGIAISSPFMTKTAEEWEKTLRINLIGVFLCAQAAARYMLKQKSGKIINISSIRGIDHCGRAGVIDYCASKTAVIGLTKTMAKELAPHINVNTVAPGHTKTEMTNSLPEEVKRNMIEGSYLKRMAEPEDIAKAIAFLASADADFITGQVLLVDGGFSLKQT
ncbi:MAG: 3-oxoacyl-ACP reductase FabG [Deltaproteobacteria bacterium]|nr:3-oxoacyl-ACP reductase FabG [Deltaproteobacteria bacterium]